MTLKCKWVALPAWHLKIMFSLSEPAQPWQEVKNRVVDVVVIKSYIIATFAAILILLTGFPAISQESDQGYQKRDIPKTEIEILYSMYSQNGNHSAVTGGTGTEELTIYAPDVDIIFNGKQSSFNLNVGADVISSASTDNIDFAVSSASVLDMRSHADIHYTRQIGKNVNFGIGTGFSLESDYLSFPFRVTFSYLTPNKMREISASFSYFYDDLRWGRLNPDYKRPVTLVYPVELRYKEWFDIYNRYSYNFKTEISQVLNRRLRVGLFPELILQKGLLSTPFHRVYFTNDSLKVENLPRSRVRVPLGAKANYFAGGSTVLKGAYQFYSDNFGITAHSIRVEAAFKMNPEVSFSPFVKLFTQTEAQYFLPYAKHDPASEFYSSDYDLSAFQTLQLGFGFRWAPFLNMGKYYLFDELNLRYSYLKRSDGLYAHLMSAAFRFSRIKDNN